MRNERRRIGIGWLVLGVLVVLSFVVFAVVLGPRRTAMISAASLLSTTVDGLAEAPGQRRLRTLDIRIDPADLDTLEADLPWSGGRNMPAMLVENGVQYPVKFRYRGVYSTSHFLGGKKSFRLSLKKDNPFSPYRRLNVVNPKSFNFLNDHLGSWIAGRMGVPVPWNEMVFVRLNGHDEGVMELFEQPSGDFERVRNLTNEQVPVYRGDYAPVVDRKLPPSRNIWRSTENWEYVSNADSTVAHAQLTALLAVITDPTWSIAQRRDTLSRLIDVDAYARYLAAILVVNTKHIDQYHNQWLVRSDRTGLFYPIFWDALLMFPPEGEPLYYIHDALAHWFLRIPEWRLMRDRYAYQALLDLQRNGAFAQELDRSVEQLMPSVLADRNKYGNVTLEPADVHRFSVVHVISSIAGMREQVRRYWEGSLARFERVDVAVERGRTMRFKTTSDIPIGLRWPAFDGPPPTLLLGTDTVLPQRNEGFWSLTIHRELVLPEDSWNRPFTDRQHYNVVPLDATLSFPNGAPADLTITNAITDEAIR